jgi:hypothetical protein
VHDGRRQKKASQNRSELINGQRSPGKFPFAE